MPMIPGDGAVFARPNALALRRGYSMNVAHFSDSSADSANGPSKYLTFVLGDESYGIEITHVTEIVGMQKITPIPDAPHYVRGVINLRGKVIPVIDVRMRFGLSEREYNSRTCIIVLAVRGQDVGMIVDRVQEVHDIGDGVMQAPPSFGDGGSPPYVKGVAKVEDGVRILLDADRLLFQ
jgi:purine-binding chemotaxis protein CheW